IEPQWLQALADDLQAHHGQALVVAGPHLPPAVHAIVHAINSKLGAAGRGVLYQQPVAAAGPAGDLRDLTAAIEADSVETLIMMDSNPVYTAAADLDFAQHLKTVPLRVHWGVYRDETARYAH